MTIYDLKQTLHSGYWAMLPEKFASFNASVEALVKGEFPIRDVQKESATQGSGDTVVINVTGTLLKAGGMSKQISQLLGIADIDALYQELSAISPNVENVVLNFDSPGGAVPGTYELGALINELGNSRNVTGYSSGLCASAAYWLASQCNEFFCSPSSLIGHVGIANKRFDMSEANKASGVNIVFTASSPRKFWGDPEYPVSDEERADIKQRIEQETAKFKASVLANRSIDVSLLDAHVFDGLEAVKHNFAEGNFNSLAGLLKLVTKQG